MTHTSELTLPFLFACPCCFEPDATDDPGWRCDECRDIACTTCNDCEAELCLVRNVIDVMAPEVCPGGC